jgi:glycine hydroxymethyltransferase
MKDTELQNLIKKEIKRQQETINLIPSENYASPEILNVLGSPLTNKYSEGYPGKRYYPGNVYYDEIENFAQERALKVFKLKPSEWSVNVQPYSGSPANLAVYLALMNPGDTLMGMRLAAGGHLTHGHKVSVSGRLFNAVQYGVNGRTGLIDYRAIAALAKKHKPRVIVSGATAYPRILDFKKFGVIAKSVGAYHVADISHIAGLIAAGLHPSPFLYADVVMTTTHKTLRGPRGAIIFARKRDSKNPNTFELSEKKNKLESFEGNSDISNRIDKAVFPGLQGGPHNNVTAAKALMFFEALQPKFKIYQKQIVKNAASLAEELKKSGFKLVTGGTDNHLMLIDLRKTGLDGRAAEQILEKNNITANRNSIPGDTAPFKPSGIRIGTPAVTTRGMNEKEMRQIAQLICRCLVEKKSVKREIIALCNEFPIPYGVISY